MKKYSIDGEDNPRVPNALYNISYNKDGHLRIYDPHK
jgi:hypothetical protein